MMTKLRPETSTAGRETYAPTGGTAYLLIYNAVKAKKGLIHGRLHNGVGESCAIGSFFDLNNRYALDSDLIDEVAAVNDSVPHSTTKQRRGVVLRFLRWKLQMLGMAMPGPPPKGFA